MNYDSDSDRSNPIIGFKKSQNKYNAIDNKPTDQQSSAGEERLLLVEEPIHIWETTAKEMSAATGLTKECFLDGFVNEYDAIDNDDNESSSSSHVYQTGNEHVPLNDDALESTKERSLPTKETINRGETTATETTAKGVVKGVLPNMQGRKRL